MRAATDALLGATNAMGCNGCGNECNGCNECDCTTNATTGATDARSGMRELCLGARRVGDSNTKWWGQGVLPGAHNLLEIGRSSTKWAK
jgi:hypothetical protein